LIRAAASTQTFGVPLIEELMPPIAYLLIAVSAIVIVVLGINAFRDVVGARQAKKLLARATSNPDGLLESFADANDELRQLIVTALAGTKSQDNLARLVTLLPLSNRTVKQSIKDAFVTNRTLAQEVLLEKLTGAGQLTCKNPTDLDVAHILKDLGLPNSHPVFTHLHEWSGCTCSNCRWHRDQNHDWKYYLYSAPPGRTDSRHYCKICGVSGPHKYPDYDGSDFITCQICRMTVNR
jgi:hypothetical protein